MKKLLILLMVLAMSLFLFIGCGEDAAGDEDVNEEGTENGEEVAEEEEEEQDEAITEGSVALVGLGHNISIARSRDMSDEDTAQAQADVTAAAVGFDADGTIVSVSIDVAQTRVAFDEDMQVTSDKDALVPSKKELGDDYGMAAASGIDKEWYEQIEALEEWMIGQNIDDVLALDLNEDNAPDVADLHSSVTITVTSYLDAVEEAWENAVDAEGAETVGLGLRTYIDKSRDASDEDNAQAQVDTYVTATAFDADGTIVNTLIDVAQVRVAFDEDGQVESDRGAELQTKKERGDDYGMARVSEIEKEWYEQIEAFEAWLVGQTIEEAMTVELNDNDAPDVADLESSVTITVTGYLSVVENAYDNAR